MEVDHINREKLDNRKANLRWVTRAANIANSTARSDSGSKAKGVRRFDGINGTKWRASITRHRKATHLGSFDTREAAIAAFEAAHNETYGGQ
jgi:hypothetical protein